LKKRIYYHDTDGGQVVYYANYLKYLEEARTELLENKGVLIKELQKQDTLFVVNRQEINYKLPAYYGDTLTVDTAIANISGVRIEFEYKIMNQHGQVIADAKQFWPV
jgi:acyl-CoA thioester hydrolase